MNEKLSPQHLDTWRLFITSHTRLINAIDKDLSEAGCIPLNWYDVLIELYEAPEKRLRMSELADKVLLTRSGLTRLVDRLEKAHYLTREIDPDDRRGFYAIITDDGIAAMRSAWRVYSRGIRRFFADHLGDEEVHLLHDLFSRFLRNLDTLT